MLRLRDGLGERGASQLTRLTPSTQVTKSDPNYRNEPFLTLLLLRLHLGKGRTGWLLCQSLAVPRSVTKKINRAVWRCALPASNTVSVGGLRPTSREWEGSHLSFTTNEGFPELPWWLPSCLVQPRLLAGHRFLNTLSYTKEPCGKPKEGKFCIHNTKPACSSASWFSIWAKLGPKTELVPTHFSVVLAPAFQQSRSQLAEAHKSKEKLCWHLHDSKFASWTPNHLLLPLQTDLLPVS